MQTEILAKNSLAALRIYAIWFNMYPGDERSKWDASLITDSRVTLFWDQEKVAGRWFREHNIADCDAEILWDAFLLFGPEAEWDDVPAPLISWGVPVYHRREDLKAAIYPLFPRLSGRTGWCRVRGKRTCRASQRHQLISSRSFSDPSRSEGVADILFAPSSCPCELPLAPKTFQKKANYRINPSVARKQGITRKTQIWSLTFQ